MVTRGPFRIPRQDSYWNADGSRKQFSVYILSNSSMTLYVGVTNNLKRRISQHLAKTGSEFTSRYHFDRIVYFETFELVIDAIRREKEIKGMRRAKKIQLVKSMNPTWEDLSAQL